jgi:hypothetical protein
MEIYIRLMQFIPAFCYSIPLRSKYSPRHPVIKLPQFVCVCVCVTERGDVSYPYETICKIPHFNICFLIADGKAKKKKK